MFSNKLTKLTAVLLALFISACSDSGGSNSSGGTGQGGSLSRFAISGNTLYAIAGSSQVQIFDITTAHQPLDWQSMRVGFGIETLHINTGKLYIGANNGMYIYDISTPELPQYLSQLLHVRACDPVVVQGNYAYVTLRGGRSCRNSASNQLDVIDISDASQPKLVRTHIMSGPKGLAADGEYLFICDGIAGLKIFSILDPLNITAISNHPSQVCNDVIASNAHLIGSGDDFLSQFDYNTLPLEPLSIINTEISQAP